MSDHAPAPVSARIPLSEAAAPREEPRAEPRAALSEPDVAAIREDAKYATDAQSRRQIVQLCDSHESLRTALASARAERDKFKQLYEMHYDGMASLAEDIRRKDGALASARAALDAKDAEIRGWQRVLPGYVDRIAALQSALSEATRREEAMAAFAQHNLDCPAHPLDGRDGPCHCGFESLAARPAVSRDTPGKWLDGSAVRDVVENVNAYDRLDPASRG